MSSISIREAQRVYGGTTEGETVRMMAIVGGYSKVYKYANAYGDKKTHTDYKRIERPGDTVEQSFFASPYVYNIVLVYDKGQLVNRPITTSAEQKLDAPVGAPERTFLPKKWWQFWKR